MKFPLLAAALFAVAATPAFAQGIDSRHSPYPASAYSGALNGYAPAAVAKVRPGPAYRFSGQHAGGPADALARY